MSKVEITVENLGKLYHIGERERYKALRDVLTDAITAPRRWLRGHSEANHRNPRPDFIWALRNISLEIKQGEIVGIVGRNEAGKTTLLKILSRITEPTEGYAEVWGRVGSLYPDDSSLRTQLPINIGISRAAQRAEPTKGSGLAWRGSHFMASQVWHQQGELGDARLGQSGSALRTSRGGG